MRRTQYDRLSQQQLGFLFDTVGWATCRAPGQ